jgi:hypothetical protein
MKMEDSVKDGEDAATFDAVAPEQLLVVFSRGRILFWAAVAVLIHVVVIGVTSVGYIRDQWIDPEGAKVRKEAAAAALAAEKAREKPKPPSAPATNAPAVVATVTNAATNAPAVATNAPAVATNAAATATNGVSAAESGEDAQLEARRNTTVVRRITEAASSNEIPKRPELGISLEDTNLR